MFNLEVLGKPLKNGGSNDCYTQQFLRGFGRADQKGKDKWESSRRLESNGLDIGSHWRVQRTEYSIFLKEKAYPNVGIWKKRHAFRALDFLRLFKAFSG